MQLFHRKGTHATAAVYLIISSYDRICFNRIHRIFPSAYFLIILSVSFITFYLCCFICNVYLKRLFVTFLYHLIHIVLFVMFYIVLIHIDLFVTFISFNSYRFICDVLYHFNSYRFICDVLYRLIPIDFI
jgi:hypothetical protein